MKKSLLMLFVLSLLCLFVFSACNDRADTPGESEGAPTATLPSEEGASMQDSGETSEEEPCLHSEVVDPAVAPTCTQKGRTEGVRCSICHEVLKAREEVPATGHSPVTDEAVKATCIAKGKTEGAHCALCSEVLTPQEEIPTTDHLYEKDYCATCGRWRYSEGLLLTLTGDHYTVSGIGDCTDEHIEISPVYDGRTVTAIGENAFFGCGKLTSLRIPEGVTSIGENAFSYCKEIKSIVIPKGVIAMGIRAFDEWSEAQVIFVEAESAPSEWNSQWNANCFAKICWGNEWTYVDGVPTLK